jgi:hypothetical protein
MKYRVIKSTNTEFDHSWYNVEIFVEKHGWYRPNDGSSHYTNVEDAVKSIEDNRPFAVHIAVEVVYEDE